MPCISGASCSTCRECHGGDIGSGVGVGVGAIGLDTVICFVMNIGSDTAVSQASKGVSGTGATGLVGEAQIPGISHWHHLPLLI